ncbi:unnamed protein product [Clonostachys rosea]|uniref:Uncharacterized protein n=1 Tax=Bionectria ochroleuca TaxID=29856 RepID=A0ABY6UDN0_BIOOC|nr:unnamed protein product [Clonostachys rosea]
MRLLFILPSLALATIRGVSSAAHVCPDAVTIQPLVFVQKTSVYASSHVCEEKTLTLAGTNIPISHVPTIVETRFEITNTITASVTLPDDANGGGLPCPVNGDSPCPFVEHGLATLAPQGEFTTMTALCSNKVGSTLTLPPPGDGRLGTKVVLLPTNDLLTGTYDTVTQPWDGISGGTVTTVTDDGDNGSTPTSAVSQPTSATSNQTSSGPASGAAVTTISSTPSASLSDLSSAIISSTSDEPSSELTSATISSSSEASSSEATSPAISSSSRASSSEATSPAIPPSSEASSSEATSPTISSSFRASSSEASSPTFSSSSKASSSEVASVPPSSSSTESLPSTTSLGSPSDSVSSLEPLTTTSSDPNSSPSVSSSSPSSTEPASSTTPCVITATPVPECCMNELPEGCQALENTNGLALEPVIQACEESLGKYATEDMLQCWEGDVRDESKGTYIADCLLYELEDCCITELPEACRRLSGATGSSVPSGAAECRDALGIFVHGIAIPCLDEANITDETQGNSIVDCLEVAYGLRSGPVTIVDNKLCPTTATP